MNRRSRLPKNLTETGQAEINAVAWKACDSFQGLADAENYKNYILVFLFLKYLSDIWKDKREEYRREYKGDENRIAQQMSRERFILPDGCDFGTIYTKRNDPDIGEVINTVLARIEEVNKAKLEGVLKRFDFNAEKPLGETRDRNRRLKNLIEGFDDPHLDLRPSRIGNHGIIGNTYHYLLEHFASNAGKKGGEFYTPPEVSRLLAKLLRPKKGALICDPACGSGSLLLRVADETGDRDFALYGQEANGNTWALCQMNMVLHGNDGARIEWGDTLGNPRLLDGGALMKFDIVVADLLFSHDKWDAEAAVDDRFYRFHRGLPPKSRADYAFITHMLETTVAGTGKVGIIVPHGVLSRSGAAERIRQRLIEENLLECVVGLPANLFYGTGIPAAVLVFNRGKKTSDVLFIDASREYEAIKNRNKLRPQDVEKIVVTHRAFRTVEKYAYRAKFEELKENDFNLNIPLYVDTFEEEEEIDIQAAQKEIEDLEAQLVEVRAEMSRYLKELGL